MYDFEEKLKWGATLSPGDIVNDCRYLNVKIKKISPRMCDGVISDYSIITEDGMGCSLINCCREPMTDEEIKRELKETDLEGFDLDEAIKFVMEHPFHNHHGKGNKK